MMGISKKIISELLIKKINLKDKDIIKNKNHKSLLIKDK